MRWEGWSLTNSTLGFKVWDCSTWWMYGWDEKGGHSLALHDDFEFENGRRDGCMDEMRWEGRSLTSSTW
jgi:hypothetical protein